MLTPLATRVWLQVAAAIFMSGFIASEVMQTGELTRAIVNAVYVHGLSGDLAAAEIGERP